jgi:activating signal cointegrator 1
MKTLSLNPPYATLIAACQHYPELGKHIETRSWSTNYRGDLVLHQTSGLGEMFADEAELVHVGRSSPTVYHPERRPQPERRISSEREISRDVSLRLNMTKPWNHISPRVLAAFCQQEPVRSTLAALGITVAAQLPRGAIVARCELVGVVSTRQLMMTNGISWQSPQGRRYTYVLTERERAFGSYEPGRYGLLLADVQALAEPIPARGMPGLWDYNGEIGQ